MAQPDAWATILRSAGLLGADMPFNTTSNVDASSLPFQRWYRFKEAFTPAFVAEVFAALPAPPRTCLDPFGGSGTTALTAQRLGVLPWTIEVNPFLADVIESKLTTYSLDEVRAGWVAVLHAVEVETSADWPNTTPPTFIEPGVRGRWIFDAAVALRIGAYRRAIQSLENPSVQRLLRVLLASALVPVSNVVISGKGRRYRGSRTNVRPTRVQLDALMDAGFRAIYDDLTRFGDRAEPDFRLLRGDARRLVSDVEPVDVVLFSPPYPNSFDYTDIYNVELWGLGYLESNEDNRQLRDLTIRSHVQRLRSFGTRDLTSPTLQSTYDQLSDRRPELWSPHIPAMIRAYFDDLSTVLDAARSRLTRDGRIIVVVGDSRYAGITVDTAAILREMASSLALEVERCVAVRSMRASAQQGGQQLLSESLIAFAPA